MATTYNIVEKRYNGTDYDTLYPATKGENLVSAVPVELGGTGGTTGAAGMKNLLDALSTVTPTGTDLLPLKDVSGNIAGKATIDSILSLVSGGAKIQTGSYVGTGTYGGSNPCSLTFDFEPKLVCMLYTVGTNRITYYFGGYGTAYGWYYVVPTESLSTSYVQYTGFYDNDASGGTSAWYGKKSSDGLSISWYDTANAHYQMNDSSLTYHWLAIG